MVSTISQSLSPSDALSPFEKAQTNGHGTPNGTSGRSQTPSRRASNQSKELADLDLPEPSRLHEPVRPTTVNPNLLSASDLDSSPFVKSIPSSPYLGASSSPASPSVPRFGDTTSDALVDKLEALELEEPEALQAGNPRDEAEKERAARELAEVMDNLVLPEPEYVTRANMRAEGAKTPEPAPREEGSAQLVRNLSQKIKRTGR